VSAIAPKLGSALHRLIDRFLGVQLDERASYGGWPSAETTRLNTHHWVDATDDRLNRLSLNNLRVLRQRAELEMRRNGILAGVQHTLQTEVVGGAGPTLRVKTEDKAYAAALEEVFTQWAKRPMLTSDMSLAEHLSMSLGQWMSAGEDISQMVRVKDSPRYWNLRLNGIYPGRVKKPLGKISDPRIVDGIETNELGRAVRYHIEEMQDPTTGSFSMKTREVPASEIIHLFPYREDDQLRGIPLIAPSLDPIADLREFGIVTLDAARQAAMWGIVTEATGDEAYDPSKDVTSTYEKFQRGMWTNLPPGRTAKHIRPEHPSANFREFVLEQLRSIGRPLNMPLNLVIADSSSWNYSGARFDLNGWLQTVQEYHSIIERRKLDRLIGMLINDMQLAAVAGRLPQRLADALRNVPDDLKITWIWPQRLHTDPDKESRADERNIKNGTSSIASTVSRRGGDPEVEEESIFAEVQRWRDRGMRHPTDAAFSAGAGAGGGDRSAIDVDVIELRERLEDLEDRLESQAFAGGRPQLNGASHGT
jgi:lambda family phage portal protein